MSLFPRLILGLAILTLAACDQPRPREMKLNPRPEPVARTAEVVVVRPDMAQRPSVFSWNAGERSFMWNGQKLQAARLWTFEGSTDGFVMSGGEVLPSEPTGLSMIARGFDSALRSPSDLAIDGVRFNHVLVRLTRLAAGDQWDGALHYATAAHPEAAAFMAHPLEGAEPEVNETVIMVYDMRALAKGGSDWIDSTIERLRLDLDDAAGGAFVVHQIAVTEAPPASAPPTLR